MVQKLRTAGLVMLMALSVAVPMTPVFEQLTPPSVAYAQAEPEPNPFAQQAPQDQESSSQTEAAPAEDEEDVLGDRCRTDIGALSWILCPIADLTNDVTEFAANFIMSALETTPLTTNTDETNILYTAWGVFRNIANILLLGAFLILIYMQVVGAKAYQIQRTLPRLVVAAVLVQLSYFVAAFIVDVGNVLAAGIGGLFSDINSQVLTEELSNQLAAGNSGEFIQLEDSGYSAPEAAGVGSLWILFGSIGAFITIFSVGFSFGALILILVGVMIAALFALMALAVRQLLIVLFVVLAPVAFILGVFPQTEKWMREWFDNFIKIIMIYPLVALVFGVSSTLSLLALETKGRDFNQLLAALLPLIALASVPLLFRFAGGIFRAVSGGMRGIAQRTASAVKGDPKNPYSMSGRVAYQRHLNRGRAAMYTTDKVLPRFPGAGKRHGAANALARKINKTTAAREMYAQGQERAKDRLSTVFKDPIHGLFFGNETVKGWRGAVNYEPSKAALLFRYGEGRDFRRDRSLYAGALEPATRLAAGGNPDYATAFMHGNLMNDLRGEVHPEIAEEFDEEFRTAVKGKHLYVNGAKYEHRKQLQQAAHENRPEGYLDNMQMIDMMYRTPMAELPDWAQEPVMKIRTGVLDDGEGMLDERQSANTFETIESFVYDPDTLNNYLRPDGVTVNEQHQDKLVGVYKKMESMVGPPQGYMGALARGAGGEDMTPAEAVAGAYKSPADIKSQEKFARARGTLKDFLDRNNIDYL